MKHTLLIAALGISTLTGCQTKDASNTTQLNTAPGAPGDRPTWAFAGKTAIGSSYEEYLEGDYSDKARTGTVSKVWFSVAEGVLTETMWGLIHHAQLKDMQLAIIGDDFVDFEIEDTEHQQHYLFTDEANRPLSPAYGLVNHDKEAKYTIEKQLFTDPDQQSLWQRITIKAHEDNVQAVLITNPHIANTGFGDEGLAEEQSLHFSDGDTHMHVAFDQSPLQTSVGFKGESGAYADLKDGRLDWQYQTTGEQTGNIIGSATFPKLNKGESYTIDMVISFGESEQAARASSASSFNRGYETVLNHYNGEGDAIGWQDYVESLDSLESIATQSTDEGKLAYASAIVLKIQEDKTHAGALIASLSNPWGDTVAAEKSATGYKAVWPRDFYQCAMAFLAMGDANTAKVAFEYLEKVQVSGNKHGNKGTGGWFYQKAEVDGQPEWVSIQLDQTGMPLMLAWQLWQQNHLSDDELAYWYQKMLMPAAEFLVSGGKVDIDWNQYELIPPLTQQERWEEQFGYSPSTTAAVIAGLVSAAEIAKTLHFDEHAMRYLAAADQYQRDLDAFTFTTNGVLGEHKNYYLRISQNTAPNDHGKLDDRNGRGQLNEQEIIDGGFLELVRYGIKPAQDEKILSTLAAIDDLSLPSALQVRYEFTGEKNKTFNGWRRYGNDGYGEDITNGANYGAGGAHGGIGGGMSAGQRGRVWPFLTGERAHYEIAAGTQRSTIKNDYIAAIEYFANEGLMLPEQVWDGVGNAGARDYSLGEGTNGATPLAWAHAEYIKLLRSTRDGKIFDQYAPVVERYQQ